MSTLVIIGAAAGGLYLLTRAASSAPPALRNCDDTDGFLFGETGALACMEENRERCEAYVSRLSNAEIDSCLKEVAAASTFGGGRGLEVDESKISARCKCIAVLGTRAPTFGEEITAAPGRAVKLARDSAERALEFGLDLVRDALGGVAGELAPFAAAGVLLWLVVR